MPRKKRSQRPDWSIESPNRSVLSDRAYIPPDVYAASRQKTGPLTSKVRTRVQVKFWREPNPKTVFHWGHRHWYGASTRTTWASQIHKGIRHHPNRSSTAHLGAVLRMLDSAVGCLAAPHPLMLTSQNLCLPTPLLSSPLLSRLLSSFRS